MSANRGEKHPLAKLTERGVRAIRFLLSGGISEKEIAPRFGVGTGTIYNIKNGKSWGWLDSLWRN
jgi:transposase